MCFKSKNVYNATNYIVRQEFINSGKWIRNFDLDKLIQKQDCYYELGSQASQKIIQLVDSNWKSFFRAVKDFNKNPSKYLGKPKLPNYLNKDGRQILILKNIQCSLKDGLFRISFKPFKGYSVNTNAKGKLMQCRFIPKGNNYVMEIVYEIDIPDAKEDNQCYIGIDLGIDNFSAVVNNIGLKPFVINGKTLKSINQYYNKEKAKLQSDLKLKHNKDWSNRLQSLTNKRNNKIKDYMHKASKELITYCQINNINTIVIGLNKGWKQESNMGKKVNQKFVSIPYDMFIKQVQYKAENVGINVIITEESYTSGTSFLDGELPCKENYDKSRRIHRGMFKTYEGTLINSDINGAYQILRKVIPDAFANGIKGVGLHPVRVNL